MREVPPPMRRPTAGGWTPGGRGALETRIGAASPFVGVRRLRLHIPKVKRSVESSVLCRRPGALFGSDGSTRPRITDGPGSDTGCRLLGLTPRPGRGHGRGKGVISDG